MRWDGNKLEQAIKWLPKGKRTGSTRVWEMQAAALEGKREDEWYRLPLAERENKVVVMVAPKWLDALEVLYGDK